MAESEFLRLQTTPSDPKPSVTKTATDMLLAPTTMAQRLRHFSENVYDLSPEAKLVKFLKVLLGDAGAGQLRKRLLLQRMQATLQGSHFYDLDRFYGPLFGLRRSVSEALDFNPYLQTATRDQWDATHAKDASFRSRIEQFSRAIAYGPTPTGMELLAEALLAVDVDVYESYIQADSSYQTNEELETLYAGNKLSDNASSVETDVTDWTAEANTTVSAPIWQPFPDGFTPGGGVRSLQLESAAAGDVSATTPGGVATPGTDYTFAAVATTDGDVDAHVEIEWYDSGPSLISTSVGDTVATEGGWPAQVFVTATAPVGAATATLRVVAVATGAAEFHTFDRMEFSETEETYAGMEEEGYGSLEGLGLGRLSGDDRRVFTIRPKRQITLAESHDLRRVLYNLKPADSRFKIQHQGVPLYIEQDIDGAYADSIYWEVISKVVAASLAINPYQVESFGEPTEQPRPPFSGYQGEAWSYVTDLAGVSAYTRSSVGASLASMPEQRVTFRNGNTMDFSAQQAVLPNRMVQAGRLVSDAVLVTYPYDAERGITDLFVLENDSDAVARLYADGIPVDQFNSVLKTLPDVDPFQQSPEFRFWATPERDMDDTTEEILEVRLSRESLVNYVTFEVAKYPHRVIVEAYDTEGARWNEVFRWEVTDSSPKMLPAGSQTLMTEGHPQHTHVNHWERLRHRFDPRETRRLRLRLRRIEGNPPQISKRGLTEGDSEEVPYSLAVRALDLGYRVSSRADFESLPTNVIGSTIDLFGSTVQFEVDEQVPTRALDGEVTAWRSEPQPVNYAVVNYYLDTREDDGEGSVIDRFFMDPTHSGPHVSIYYSNDPQDIDPEDSEGFFEGRMWTPISRDYTLQKGYFHLPPTRARYWKFEFTNLVAEAYENFVALDRQVKLFPRQLVAELDVGFGHSDEALLPGMHSASTLQPTRRYRDALRVLEQSPTQSVGTDYSPTEALYVTDLNGQVRMQDRSWVFGFTPWHQGQRAPRFSNRSVHRYEQVEVRHNTKVAFFVGLRTLKAYRSNFEANDDPVVYFDTLDDAKNLEPGFDWTFDPGQMTSLGVSVPVTATSRVFHSRSPIKAIQFATEQSNPFQLVPDSEFRDPALANYEWDNPDNYLRIGDAQLIYSPSDYSVINIRYVVPPPKAIDRFGGLVQPNHQPVFSYRPFEVADEEAAALTEGGLESPLLGLADDGRAYAAVRFTMQSEQSSPLILEVIDTTDGDAVLATKELSARKGETIEDFVAFDIPAPSTVIRMRLYQTGKSNDSWKVFSMALFDESIVWEFSVNGGGDWYKAKEVRNNDNGILSFPEPGNQLRFRVTAYRENMWVSAYKIRPHYLGVGNARLNGTHRGPNVSFYDQDVPIHEDPMFTAWKKPVPYYWYAANRRFPLLAVEGAPITGEFSRFYGRPIEADLSGSEPTIDVSYVHTKVRLMDIRLDILGAPELDTERVVIANREMETTLAEPTIDIGWSYVSGIEGGHPQPIVSPIFSESELEEPPVGDIELGWLE